MEFNNIFGFINNEEDFINFVNLYKKIRNSKTSYGFNLAGLNYNDDTLFYKKSILNTSRYIDTLLKDEIIKRDIKCIYMPYRRLLIEETLIIDESNLAIDSMIEKYNNKMMNKIKNEFYVDLQLYIYGDIKNVLVNIDEEIYNFIKDEKCLRLYLFFKYYTSRLNNDISSIEVPLFHIMQITDIYDNEIKDCINILLNNGLLRRIESETSMPRYELYNNINDNFIYDTSDKNNYIKKNKEIKDKIIEDKIIKDKIIKDKIMKEKSWDYIDPGSSLLLFLDPINVNDNQYQKLLDISFTVFYDINGIDNHYQTHGIKKGRRIICHWQCWRLVRSGRYRSFGVRTR